ncbi:hypothetical protein SBA6_1240002 [Candidatus Sulfopaludibacter sp. SbA6]|nr:hypothetical protein SBA6_1240002 [Candidatus Sulfopaludibacter sp. SbA6]
MNIRDLLAKDRLKLAWALLPAEKKAAIQPMLDGTHEQLRTFVNTGQATHAPSIPHQFLLAKSALNYDRERLLALPEPKAKDVEVKVGPDGAIWGTGKYQQRERGGGMDARAAGGYGRMTAPVARWECFIGFIGQ